MICRMAVKVYVVKDSIAIEHIENGDIDGFKAYLEVNPYVDFGKPECFKTAAEALAYCTGLGFGADERGEAAVYPLRSTEEEDVKFIEVMETVL